MTEQIDTADAVFHTPTGETWLVAYVKGDRLAWCGWPEGEAALSDCTLTRKANDAERDALLRQMARSNSRRGEYARQRLAAALGEEG
jgi:hypothetical protein